MKTALEFCINDPAAGEAATVVMSGKVMVTAGGTIAAGAAVATDASGDAVTAASTNILLWATQQKLV